MDLVTHVHDTLKPVEHPATHLVRPKKFPGISYHFFNQGPSLYGDGKPRRMESNCQVDIWTTDGNYQSIATKVIKLMSDAKFRYLREEEDIEINTGLYQKPLIFYIEYGAEDR